MKQRIKLTETQLHRIIRESVRRAMRESNYDDYDYFYDDGTGGRDVNPYPYGTELADLEDSGDKEAQMAYDWGCIERGELDESRIRRAVNRNINRLLGSRKNRR